MKGVLVLGAGGQIAHWVIATLRNDRDVTLTLFLRSAQKLGGATPHNARVVEGDVLDSAKPKTAMARQDIVYANLAGEVDAMAAVVVASMKATGVKRLIFLTSLGIYDEVPGKFGTWNRREIGESLASYRKAADIIEASGLDYTILRPAWLTDNDEIDYETTQKGEPFKGTEVSRKSVAALIVDLIRTQGTSTRRNLGVNKPNTDGDKPAFL
jgi:uncharacterized protein YbjT (DUF2867 family)